MMLSPTISYLMLIFKSVYSNSWSQDGPINAEMTFSTSKTNSEDNVERARTALDYLQLRVPVPVVRMTIVSLP